MLPPSITLGWGRRVTISSSKEAMSSTHAARVRSFAILGIAVVGGIQLGCSSGRAGRGLEVGSGGALGSDGGRPAVISLWPGRESPAMTFSFPSNAGSSLPAFLVFRGGAYSSSMGSGGGSAEWLAAQGVVGIEVAYRTRFTGDAYPANYSDAARAMRLVRQ